MRLSVFFFKEIFCCVDGNRNMMRMTEAIGWHIVITLKESYLCRCIIWQKMMRIRSVRTLEKVALSNNMSFLQTKEICSQLEDSNTKNVFVSTVFNNPNSCIKYLGNIDFIWNSHIKMITFWCTWLVDFDCSSIYWQHS